MSIKQTTNFFLFVFFLLAFNPLGAEKLNVVFLTDTHIGENCNGVLDYEVCKPVRALTDAVNKICSLQRVDAVFVTGDLTSSAQQREFEKFNEIMSVLDKGNIPWFPLLGNHDSWPYKKLSDGSFKQTETPEGDQRFARIFKSRLETGYKHHAFVSNWPNSTCPNQDYKGVQSWFHNFQVTFPDVFPGLSFLALDWTSRKSALPEPGVGPEAELHDFDCGTTDWLSARLSESSDSDRFFLLQHHPFHNRDSLDPLGHNRVYNFTFDDRQDARLQSLLSGLRHPSDFLGVQAGHLHRWYNGSAFTRFTAIDESWLALPEIETAACKGWFADEDFTGAFTMATFSRDANSARILPEFQPWWITPSGQWVRRIYERGGPDESVLHAFRLVT